MNLFLGIIIVISAVISNCVSKIYDQSTGSIPFRTAYEFPEPEFRLLSPRGFELSIPAQEGMTLITFHGKINNKFIEMENGTIYLDVNQQENGRFVIRELNTDIHYGDKLYYWLSLIINKSVYYLLNKVYEINRTVEFPTETTIQHRITRDTKNSSCIPSVSKVNGETGLCKYSIIFSDYFSGESLDKTKWDFERRFGGDPDYEFVLYSDQNAQIIDNKLEIKLSENKDLRQFYEVSNCTGKESTECVYYPTKVRDIMAPIMSSRISTKKSFSFQYGRIEIRAKLPKGDWVVPLLILEPKEFKYDSEDYRNGQIRIAFIENNPTTQRRFKQGPLLGAKEPFRTSYMSKLISNLKSKPHFHKYVVEWKPDGITTFMDDKAGEVRDWRKDASSIPGSEAWSESKTAVAPFDQEFFISLGVSVGGINDFQSGTPWDLRSPTQHREFNETNWRTILNPDDSTLVVDYVKVFAVS